MSMSSDIIADIESGDDSPSGSASGDELTTAAEVLAKLEEAWLNEKFCPELLAHRLEVVECIADQVDQMEANIERAKKSDFKVSIHRMEIDRIRYVLSSYLRIRLEKIEKFTVDVLEAQASSALLSPDEQAYARRYRVQLEEHLKILSLDQMPANLQALDPKQTALRPNLDSYVFTHANVDISGVLVEEETVDSGEEIIDLSQSDQHIMSYRPIASFLAAGSISLI